MVWFLAFAFAQWKTIGPQIGGWSPLPQIQWQVGAFMISLVAGGETPPPYTALQEVLRCTAMQFFEKGILWDTWITRYFTRQNFCSSSSSSSTSSATSSTTTCREQWCGNIGIWGCVPPRLGIWHTPDQDNRDTCIKSNIYEQRLCTLYICLARGFLCCIDFTNNVANITRLAKMSSIRISHFVCLSFSWISLHSPVLNYQKLAK